MPVLNFTGLAFVVLAGVVPGTRPAYPTITDSERSSRTIGIPSSSTPGRIADAGDGQGSGRLTVRPQAMATGLRNAQAGERQLASLDGALVYVPAQCVGTRRVPLVVVVHGGNSSAREIIDRQRQFADKYGMIILAPNAPLEDLGIFSGRHWSRTEQNRAVIDSAMKIVLREYAIDPNKIALTGVSEGGAMSLWLGRSNLDVFGRVAVVSPSGGYYNSGGPQNTTTRFLFAAGIGENGNMWNKPFDIARQERQAGRAVDFVVLLRGHEMRTADDALIWTWVQHSWAMPKVAGLIAPPADSTLVLTTEMLGRLGNFWERLMKEPRSILDRPARFLNVDSVVPTSREANQKFITMLVGQERVVVPMMDISALAKNAAVSDDLRQAGLTAQQAETSRIALLSALATTKTITATVAAASALEKNVAFLQEHRAEVDALTHAKMWEIP